MPIPYYTTVCFAGHANLTNAVGQPISVVELAEKSILRKLSASTTEWFLWRSQIKTVPRRFSEKINSKYGIRLGEELNINATIVGDAGRYCIGYFMAALQQKAWSGLARPDISRRLGPPALPPTFPASQLRNGNRSMRNHRHGPTR